MRQCQARHAPAPRMALPHRLSAYYRALAQRLPVPAVKAARSNKPTLHREKPTAHRPTRLAVSAAVQSGEQGGKAGDGSGQPRAPSPDALLEDFMKMEEEMRKAGFAAAGEEELAAAAEEPVDAEDAMAGMRMGTWRLRDKVCPQIEVLVAQIENSWRSILSDLGLYPLPKEWKYMDSMDPEGKVPFAYQTLKSPEKGEPGWPRLQVENRCYQSRAFRKLHLEVAVRQDGLQVLHCVMYPRLGFDLPILSMDLVANNDRISLAIVDPCPVSANLTLPRHYLQGVRELQARYSLQNNRKVPDWGAAIFSQECVILRPTEGKEIADFIKYALALTEFHLQLGRLANPSIERRAARLKEMHAAHKRYCEKQLENDKTRQVLAKSFGGERAEAYMREVMFDCEELPADVATA